MGFQKSNGEWADTDPIYFLDAAAISATGSSAVMETGDRASMRLTANFSAVAGTNPTLDIAVMTCETSDGTFRLAGNFLQFTGATSKRETITGLDRYVRLDYTLGGTANPAFTGTISGELV